MDILIESKPCYPPDWKTDKLGNYVVINSGNSSIKINSDRSGIPYFKVDQLNNSNKYIFESPYHIDSKTKVKKGSLIFPKRGASIFLNKVRILSEDSFMDTNLMAITPNEDIYNEFLYYFLIYLKLWKIADTTSIPQLNNKHLNPLEIVFPSLPEQRAIAEALSDMDALIAAQEALIAKKRAIKQGVMQELLTGKRRLPGFSGEWGYRKLGEISNVIMGQSPNSSYYNINGVGLPLIQGNADIKNRKSIIRNFSSQITKRCKKGDVILTVRAPVGEVALANFESCLGRGVCSISYSNQFLFYYLIYLEPSWNKFSKGSTFDSINSNEVKKLEILIPLVEMEQIAISEILDDMDYEILNLESKLEKYNLIKQGMMQELLTGRIRLM